MRIGTYRHCHGPFVAKYGLQQHHCSHIYSSCGPELGDETGWCLLCRDAVYSRAAIDRVWLIITADAQQQLYIMKGSHGDLYVILNARDNDPGC